MSTASIYARDISQISGAAAGATAAGIAAVSGTSIAAAGATAAPLTLGISAAVAGLAALVSTFFKGANPLQVPAAKVEQTFELACDNLWTFYKLGMLSKDAALQGMRDMLTAGQQSLQALILQFPGSQADITKAVNKGQVNMAKTINAEMAGFSVYTPPVSNVPLDFSTAQSQFTGGPGWYPESLAASLQLTQQWVSNLTPLDSTEALISQLPGMSGAVTALSTYTGISPAWATLVIVLLVLFLLWRIFLK